METTRKWQVITIVTMVLITMVLSIVTEGCFKRSQNDSGSSAPSEVKTLTFTAQPPVVPTCAGISMTAVTVEVKDQYDKVMSDTAVTITTTDNSVVISGTRVITTSASGTATFNDLIITKTDTYTLKAYVGVISQNSNPFTITAASLDNYLVTPATLNLGVGVTSTGTATARDTYGNTITVASARLLTPSITDGTGSPIVTFASSATALDSVTTYNTWVDGVLTFYYSATPNGATFTITVTAESKTGKSAVITIN